MILQRQSPTSRQLLLTLFICSSVHVLFTWGSLSQWNDHSPVQVCLFRWAHPSGYSGLGTSLAEAMPIDAVLTAFFTCLGAMKRIGDVQRGWAPHVPPEALHRGPLWLLFPRGTAALPRISSLLGVALVWGCLWGGLLARRAAERAKPTAVALSSSTTPGYCPVRLARCASL